MLPSHDFSVVATMILFFNIRSSVILKTSGLAQTYSMTPRVPYTAIGLHDPGNNGTWVWTDGQKFTYSNWEKKPRPADGHCAFMCTNASECRVGTWKAMPCDDQKNADMNLLCQRRPYMR